MSVVPLFITAKKWEKNKFPSLINYIYIYKFGHKKEWSTHTCYKMDEP